MFRKFSSKFTNSHHHSPTFAELMIHDGDVDESQLPTPPPFKSWVKDHDTNVWALMPDPNKRNTAVAAPGFVAPKVEFAELNNMHKEEDWEMISDNEEENDEGQSTISSLASHSFISLHAPRSNSVRSINSDRTNNSTTNNTALLSNHNSTNTGYSQNTQNGNGSTSSTRSFTSALIKDVAALAMNSNNSYTIPEQPLTQQEQDDISTIDSLSIILKQQHHQPLAAASLNHKNSDTTMYIEHIVLPSDTLQGICLSYRISASKLRQVNRFTGNNNNSLLEAPKKLIIPLTQKNVAQGIKQQDQNSEEYKTYYLICECHSKKLDKVQAQEVLRRCNWDLEEALKIVNSVPVDENGSLLSFGSSNMHNDHKKHGKSRSNDLSLAADVNEDVEKTPRRRGEGGLSFQIAIKGNIAYPTKFSKTPPTMKDI